MNIETRWMVRRDMSEVLEVESKSFDIPWRAEDFLHVLRQRNCNGTVATVNGDVVGFMVHSLQKTSYEVLNFAVHPDWRGKGVGRRLIERLAGKLSESRRTEITLEVRETNLGAQLFFRDMGFKATAVLRGHFNGEDAYRMRYGLAESSAVEA